MKSVSVVVAFGLVAAIYAQQECVSIAAKVPSCATGCIAPAAKAVGCALTDFVCQCSASQSAAIASSALPCVVSACGVVSGLAVQSAAADVCSCAATAAPVSASTTSEETSTTSKEASATSKEALTTSEKVTTSATSSAKSSSIKTPAVTVPPTTTPPFPTKTGGGSVASSASVPSGTASVGSKASKGSTTPFTGGAAQAVGSVSTVLGALLIAIWVL